MGQEVVLVKKPDGEIVYGGYYTVTDTLYSELYPTIKETKHMKDHDSVDRVSDFIEVELYINYGDGMYFDKALVTADFKHIIYPETEDQLLFEGRSGIPHWAKKNMNNQNINYSNEYNDIDLIVLKNGIGINGGEIAVVIKEMLDLPFSISVIRKQGNNIYWKWSCWDLEISDSGLVPIKDIKKVINKKINKEIERMKNEE